MEMEIEKHKYKIIAAVIKKGNFHPESVQIIIQEVMDIRRFAKNIAEADNIFQKIIIEHDRNNGIYKPLRNETVSKMTERFYLDIEKDGEISNYDISVLEYSNEKIPEGFLYQVYVQKR